MTSPTPEIDLPSDHILRQLLDAIAAHPEVREPLLRALLTEDLLTLPKRVDNLQGEFQEFREETRAGFRAVNERIDATNAEVRTLGDRLDENTSRLDENTSRLDENTSRLDENTSRLEENTRAIRRLEGHVGRLTGNSYEDLCRREIGAILDGWLEVPVLADRDLIDSRLLESRQRDSISRHEYLDGLRPDIVARGSEDSGHAGPLAVVEVSVTFNRMDLENAANRAGVIAKVTGLEVIPFLVTHSRWPVEVTAAAEALGVSIIRHEDPNAPARRRLTLTLESRNSLALAIQGRSSQHPYRANIFIRFAGFRDFDICRISFCVCLNWFSSWLMSCGVVPLPLDILRRLLPLMISGRLRSCGVIE